MLKQHKGAQAIAQFLIASELDPDSGLIALNLSGAYSLEGRKQESLESFEKAFKLLGSKIITVVNNPALDNIRNEEEFKGILRKAYQLPDEKSAAPKEKKTAAPEKVKEPENGRK
ncbi:MAG: hypothetical protein PHV59_02295 [Victivallales bacterium]|nr:hypothetical protein [Victivallales bacterium]